MTKIYNGIFKKKNGEIREMVFVRLEDLDPTFLSSKILGTGKKKELGEGMELVWDVGEENFRTFNWSTSIGEPHVIEVDYNPAIHRQ